MSSTRLTASERSPLPSPSRPPCAFRRSSSGGGTSRLGHPSGVASGFRESHAWTSRRLSQFVKMASLLRSRFVSGSRLTPTETPRAPRTGREAVWRQYVSMASRSYVFPLPATNTGSRIITLVMGHKSSSGSSSPGNVGVSASFLWTPTPDVESASFVRAVSGSDTGTTGSASAAGTSTSPSEVMSAGAGSPTARPSTGRRVPSRRDTLVRLTRRNAC